MAVCRGAVTQRREAGARPRLVPHAAGEQIRGGDCCRPGRSPAWSTGGGAEGNGSRAEPPLLQPRRSSSKDWRRQCSREHPFLPLAQWSSSSGPLCGPQTVFVPVLFLHISTRLCSVRRTSLVVFLLTESGLRPSEGQRTGPLLQSWRTPASGKTDGAPGSGRPPWTQARALERVGLAPTMEPTGLRLWDPDTSSGKPTGPSSPSRRLLRS